MPKIDDFSSKDEIVCDSLFLDSPFLPHAIVLTGGIASGKSTCIKILQEWGFSVVCADSIAHQVLEENADKLVEIFGEKILLDFVFDMKSKNPQKSQPKINRKELGKIIFADDKKRKLLESITHPQIHAKIYAKAQELEKTLSQKSQNNEQKKYYFLDIPLFFEGGGKARYNARFSLSIITTKALQLERILRRDLLSLEQAQQRINSQMPSVEKMQKSDFVLFNNTTLEELESSLKDFIEMLDLCEKK